MFHSCLSCSTVMQSTARSLFVATAMPSLATTISVYFTPPLSQTGTSSSSSIGRDAVEMSVSPAQNFSKPPPVPDVPTVIFTSGYSSLNSSAAASANGATVDEPSIAIEPLTSPPSPLADVSPACRRWRAPPPPRHRRRPCSTPACSRERTPPQFVPLHRYASSHRWCPSLGPGRLPLRPRPSTVRHTTPVAALPRAFFTARRLVRENARLVIGR